MTLLEAISRRLEEEATPDEEPMPRGDDSIPSHSPRASLTRVPIPQGLEDAMASIETCFAAVAAIASSLRATASPSSRDKFDELLSTLHTGTSAVAGLKEEHVSLLNTITLKEGQLLTVRQREAGVLSRLTAKFEARLKKEEERCKELQEKNRLLELQAADSQRSHEALRRMSSTSVLPPQHDDPFVIEPFHTKRDARREPSSSLNHRPAPRKTRPSVLVTGACEGKLESLRRRVEEGLGSRKVAPYARIAQRLLTTYDSLKSVMQSMRQLVADAGADIRNKIAEIEDVMDAEPELPSEDKEKAAAAYQRMQRRMSEGDGTLSKASVLRTLGSDKAAPCLVKAVFDSIETNDDGNVTLSAWTKHLASFSASNRGIVNGIIEWVEHAGQEEAPFSWVDGWGSRRVSHATHDSSKSPSRSSSPTRPTAGWRGSSFISLNSTGTSLPDKEHRAPSFATEPQRRSSVATTTPTMPRENDSFRLVSIPNTPYDERSASFTTQPKVEVRRLSFARPTQPLPQRMSTLVTPRDEKESSDEVAAEQPRPPRAPASDISKSPEISPRPPPTSGKKEKRVSYTRRRSLPAVTTTNRRGSRTKGADACVSCHRTVDQLGRALRRCPCLQVMYCNEACQAKDWQEHMKVCSKAAKTVETPAKPRQHRPRVGVSMSEIEWEGPVASWGDFLALPDSKAFVVGPKDANIGGLRKYGAAWGKPSQTEAVACAMANCPCEPGSGMVIYPPKKVNVTTPTAEATEAAAAAARGLLQDGGTSSDTLPVIA